MNLSERIAQAALDHYSKHPSLASSSRGKPKEGSEWTVYSALVAQELQEQVNNNDVLWVVSCATGTKCAGLPHSCGGWIVHDSHAEVLVRRGLLHALWNEILLLEEGDSSIPVSPNKEHRLLERVPGLDDSSRLQVRLRRNLQLHLYISDSPCGDASIYDLLTSVVAYEGEGSLASPDLSSVATTTTTTTTQFTGSKLVVSSGTGLGWDGLQPLCPDRRPLSSSSSLTSHALLAREPEQQLRGRLRSKSAHSNVAHRTSSMSCSDKLVRWQVLGWQGSVLSSCLVERIRVTSVVVSQDPRQVNQEEALHRALVQRSEEVGQVLQAKLSNQVAREFWSSKVKAPFYVSTVEATFSCGKSAVLSSQLNQAMASSKKRKWFDGDKVGVGTPSEAVCRAKISPCGFSINWNCSCAEGQRDAVEVLVGARGTRQGKKPTTNDQFAALQSRLSRSSFVTLAQRVRMDALKGTSYQAFKQSNARPGYDDVKDLILQREGPLAGWLVTNGEGDFKL